MHEGSKNYFNMQLTFPSTSQYFFGQCKDHEENVVKLGISDILGSWVRNQGGLEIKFEKHYRREHIVNYRGDLTKQADEWRVVGEYYGGVDLFEMVYLQNDRKKVLNQNKEMALFSNMKDVYMNQPELVKHLADFKIRCRNGEDIWAHKIVLASQSKFFEGFFRSEVKHSVLLDFELEYVKSCIDYMFTAKLVMIDEESVQGILEVANYLGMNCLVDNCAEIICENIDLDNCVEVAMLANDIASEQMKMVIKKFFVDNFNQLISSGHVYHLPLTTLRSVLQSNDLVVETAKGNVVPGIHREFHLLAVAHRWMKNQHSSSLHLSHFLDCIKFGSFLSTNLEQLKLPNIFRAVLKSKFQDYEEIEDRMEIISCFDDLSLTNPWLCVAKPRKKSTETFYLYDPRSRNVIRQGHDRFDPSNKEGWFDMSCDHFNHNISGISLYTKENQDWTVLKRINLTFCDGKEKSVTTQVGAYDTIQQLDLGMGDCSRHVLLLFGPWVADPLEHLLNLNFLLSDGAILNFGDHATSDRTMIQSVLDFLPSSVHAGNLRWVGLCGNVLNTSQCGDSIIANLKLKFYSLCDQD